MRHQQAKLNCSVQANEPSGSSSCTKTAGGKRQRHGQLIGRAWWRELQSGRKGWGSHFRKHKSSDRTAAFCRRHSRAQLPALPWVALPATGLIPNITIRLWSNHKDDAHTDAESDLIRNPTTCCFDFKSANFRFFPWIWTRKYYEKTMCMKQVFYSYS